MRRWVIPTIYTIGSLATAIILPRIENVFAPELTHSMSVSSATAFFSAAASGIMTFTAIIVSIAFVIVQFSAIAYSPRLVLWFANKPELYHALGIFIATFTYAMAALLWTDRGGTGTVPYLSTIIVLTLLAASMIIFSRLVQSLSQLQITEVLRSIGEEGRVTIDVQKRFLAGARDSSLAPSPSGHRCSPGGIPIIYSGPPRSVTSIDIGVLIRLAQTTCHTIIVSVAVGDTIMEGSPLMIIEGDGSRPSDSLLRSSIRLGSERTFEQDPKYAIRLLVDIAIKALSPAINDPTTAVQALDQIEDLLRRLGQQHLGSRWFQTSEGGPRVYLPMPTWDDYLSLSFHEIRQFGASSIQLLRRLTAVLDNLQLVLTDPKKRDALKRYRTHLGQTVRRSGFDQQDRLAAMTGDSQGLGLSSAPRRRRRIRQRTRTTVPIIDK